MSRIQSVAIGIQHHFFILCGFAGALILFPSKLEMEGIIKTHLLALSFLSLFLMHTWGSLFNQFCIQCFSPYQMFYSVAGSLFIVIVFFQRHQRLDSPPRASHRCVITLRGGLRLLLFPTHRRVGAGGD
ncbi:MAG: hypothetical protein U0V48_11665 [Anaerolineales bacterium]